MPNLNKIYLGLILLMVLSAVFAGITFWLKPIPPEAPHFPDITQLTVDEALKMSPLWVDARPLADYQSGAIPLATHLSLKDWDVAFPTFVEKWRPEKNVVVYCDGGACLTSGELAERLKKAVSGIKVYILKGGYPSWLSYSLSK